MKPRKLAPRAIIITLVLLAGLFYLYPTFRYSQLKTREEAEAQVIAQKMGVSFPFVIEALYREDAVLLDKLNSLTDLDASTKADIGSRITKIQTLHRDQMAGLRKKAIKQGLDLQGGMHLVLEVDVVQLMRNLARQRDARLDKLLGTIQQQLNDDATRDFETVVVDVFDAEDVKLSQYYGEAGESNTTVISMITKQADDAINRSLEILRNRIDQFGVSEPTIQKQGSRRIVLELPGIQDQSRARDLIGRTALLEFKLVADQEKTQLILKNIDRVLAGSSPISPTTEAQATAANGSDTVAAMDLTAEMNAEAGASTTDTSAIAMESGATPFSGLLRGIRGDVAVPTESMRQVRDYLANPMVQSQIPDGVQFLWGAKAEPAGDGKEYNLLYLVKTNSELTGAALSDARVDIGGGGGNDPNAAGQPVVSLSLNRDGARTFSRVTGANIQKRLAIVLDDKIYMAPVIRSKIPNGRAVIEGSADVEEANDLAIVLRAGALPTSVVIEEERTVGPSLGRDSIRKGTTSALIGALLTIFFMSIYYRWSGTMAGFAMLLNLFLLMAGVAFFGASGLGASLTLPGMAGIALTIGMAVDANVLIFERIREELETGKSVFHAVSAGYDRAFVTILDSNLTTMIAGLVLLQFGTGPVRGFAVTLCVGLLANLFTSVTITRFLYDWYLTRKNITTLSI